MLVWVSGKGVIKLEKEERWQWNVPVRKSLYEQMKGLAKQNRISMPSITELAFMRYLDEAIKEVYTNEDEVSMEINLIKERLDKLEKRKR